MVQRDTNNAATKTAVEQLGRKVTVYKADLSATQSVTALVPNLLKDGHRIDILLNCAGIQRRNPSQQFPLVDWSEVHRTQIGY